MSVKTYSNSDKTQLSDHFNVQEFKCKCGKSHNILVSEELVTKLEELYSFLNCSKIIVNSGYRCSTHDKNVGGSGSGQHVNGTAADIVCYCKNGGKIDTKIVSCVAQDLGFMGIANIDNSYTAIHVDVRTSNKYYGNETKGYNTVTNDFYTYYGVTKEDIEKVSNVPLNTPTGTIFKGIDVSTWQGNIDWKKVKDSGQVEFAILRAGYGKLASQKDNKFEEYYAECKKNNIPVGVYWYSYATTAADALLEAQACAEVIKDKTFEYPIMFDYEESKQCDKSIAYAVIPTFMEEMKKRGYYVGLYSYYSMLKNYIPTDISNKYDVWVAHYATSTPYRGHTGWQYSSKGRVLGINGDVDMDYIYLDYPTIIKNAGMNGLKPDPNTTPVDPEPSTGVDEDKISVPEPILKPQDQSTISSFNAGDNVKLSNTPLYTTASESNSSSNKSGDYWIYDNEVVNNRIKITNSKDNVGKKPVGTYVTGWINKNDILDIDTSTNIEISSGSQITLSNTPLYTTASVSSSCGKKSGTYWIYDNEVVNNRIKITNSKDNVGKKPVGTYVTGWINKNDIK